MTLAYKSRKYPIAVLEQCCTLRRQRDPSLSKKEIEKITRVPSFIQKALYRAENIEYDKNLILKGRTLTYTLDQKNIFIKLKQEGKSCKEITKLTNISKRVQYYIIKTENLDLKLNIEQKNKLVKEGILQIPEQDRKNSKSFTKTETFRLKRSQLSKEYFRTLDPEILKKINEKRKITIANSLPIIDGKPQHHIAVYSRQHMLQDANVENIEQYAQKLADTFSGKYISGYKTIDDKCDWLCLQGHSFQSSPRRIRTGYGCVVCQITGSKEQREINSLINDWGFTTAFDIGHGDYRPDIFIPSLNLIIEYNGLLFHGELPIFKLQKPLLRSYHYDKMKYYENQGIRTINIFSDEWINKKEICIGYLKSILNVNLIKIGARKCIFKEIERREIVNFMNQNHIQGFAGHKIYGLFYEDILVAAASFRQTSLSRKGTPEEGIWELSRYCVKIGYKVIGGLGKLLAIFKNEYDPKIITSYSDNRWSSGKLYTALNFQLKDEVRPSYSYFKYGTDQPRYHKSMFRKSKILKNWEGPPKTEWAMMQELGFDRIWDCGLKKWLLECK